MNHGKEHSRRREINDVTEGEGGGGNSHSILSRIPIKHIKQFKIRNMDIPIQGRSHSFGPFTYTCSSTACAFPWQRTYNFDRIRTKIWNCKNSCGGTERVDLTYWKVRRDLWRIFWWSPPRRPARKRKVCDIRGRTF